MKKLAIAILCLNEEKDLPRCLQSTLLLECDTYLFDSGSTDSSCEIAIMNNAKVIDFRWNGMYPKKKQWISEYLQEEYEWILMLDSDEFLNENLAIEIKNQINSERRYSAYDVSLEYWFAGKKLNHGIRIKKRILFKPKEVKFPILNDLEVSNMWEVEGHYQPSVQQGRLGNLKSKLIHFDTGSLYSWFERHNRYSDWEAFVLSRKDLRETLYLFRTKRARILTYLPLQGMIVFLYSFVFKLGFLDGRAGLDYAIHHWFYQWQIDLKKRSL